MGCLKIGWGRCTHEGTPFQQSTNKQQSYGRSLLWNGRALACDARRDKPFQQEMESNPLGLLESLEICASETDILQPALSRSKKCLLLVEVRQRPLVKGRENLE